MIYFLYYCVELTEELTVMCNCSAALVYSPESVATILAICARSLLSSSCRAVVRFSAVTPGFLSPSILLPSRRKLGTEEFLWSTRSGVGLHSCFRGRESLLRTDKWVMSNYPIAFNTKGWLSFPNWNHSINFVSNYIPHSGICLLLICDNPGYVSQGRNHRAVHGPKRGQSG